MGHGLLGRHVREFLTAAAPERPPGCGQDEPGHLVAASPAQGLGEGGVFGVDGHQLSRRRQVGDQSPADHEGFLVRQGQGEACSQCSEGGFQSRRPRDGVHHHIALQGGQLSRCPGTGQQLGCLDPASREFVFQVRCPIRSGQGHVRGPEPRHLPGQQVDVAARGGQPHHVEPVRPGTDHVECLGAYGPGGAE